MSPDVDKFLIEYPNWFGNAAHQPTDVVEKLMLFYCQFYDVEWAGRVCGKHHIKLYRKGYAEACSAPRQKLEWERPDVN